MMRRANPTFVLRNWIAQDAIEVRALTACMHGIRDNKHGGPNTACLSACLMTCISPTEPAGNSHAHMFFLKQAAEKQDFSRVRAVLQLLEDPFDHWWVEGSYASCDTEDKKEAAQEEVLGRYRGKPTPEWAAELVCTCSS